ncbi:hypothetical protein BpHYR1_034295 [Brachionus plicatilis]|uniref:Uncharacterized protein n=1 Tax=Brachionus plicatilis TaxID=10195 RepID=A0A3M7RUV5_BRAPC|nr:hypothetical protein BpHYR1_034295 [Brachionus plicatilis]
MKTNLIQLHSYDKLIFTLAEEDPWCYLNIIYLYPRFSRGHQKFFSKKIVKMKIMIAKATILFIIQPKIKIKSLKLRIDLKIFMLMKSILRSEQLSKRRLRNFITQNGIYNL